MKIKRIALFCVYCKSQKLLKSDIVIYEELRKVTSRIIVIINGICNNLDLFTKKNVVIIQRENAGYDAGAYKEILDIANIRNEIIGAEELILCNNSFFGPFISLTLIFNNMDKVTCDYWGISVSKYDLVEQIQSYFLVFRTKILRENSLFSFLDACIDNSMGYDDICRNFENGLIPWMKTRGYTYSSYVDTITCDYYKNSIGSLVIDGLPILKRKAFDSNNFSEQNSLSSLYYIKHKYKYSLLEILEDINFLYDINVTEKDIEYLNEFEVKKDLCPSPFGVTREDLLKFIEDNDELFIWGTGNTAKYIYNTFFFFPNSIKMKGFIISNDQECYVKNIYGKPVIIEENINKKDVAIIVAVSKENTYQIEKKLKRNEKVMYLW